MTYSYTQISQYLSCPRRYRHRYLDGWQEKDTRAAMLFGRAFPQNTCSSCPYVGLCLGRREIVDVNLVRRPGADSFDWLDELNY